MTVTTTKHYWKEVNFMPKLSNKAYDWWKFILLKVVPALTFALGSLGTLLNWEQATLIIALLGIFATFMGTVLGISTKKYNEGTEN